MRVLSLAIVVAMAGSGMAIQDPATARPLVVVVDTDAPAANPVEAARLRAALLDRLDPSGAATYFQLTTDRLAPVPAAEVLSVRRTVFTITPPTYSGVSVTFAESVEVLRGNESVRDELIASRCPSDCGGLVHAAVEAEVKRVETAGARKLRSLSSNAAQWRGTRVVVITTGWPTRDDGRVGLSRALRELRDSGASLLIVRQPTRDPYRGLVRDASESLAAQLPAPFVELGDDADMARVEAIVMPGMVAATATPAADLAAPDAVRSLPVADAPAASPEPPDSPIARTEAAASAEPATAATGASALDATLQKAAAYVVRFERTFTSVLWHERYEQEDRVWRRFGASGAVTSTVAGRRTLESEMFFAWLPQDGTWITVRDVLAVDGKTVPPGERRLPALATRATISLLELRDLARENGRYNIGSIVRTFNEPTLALLFLDERHLPRVSFSRKGARRVDGRSLVTYAFVEAGRPTLIRSDRRDVPARGTFDIDAATGEIWKTTIAMVVPATALTGTMTVEYRPHVAFDVLVPHEMRESYAAAAREQVAATAMYSDFRRFQTSGRIVLTPQ